MKFISSEAFLLFAEAGWKIDGQIGSQQVVNYFSWIQKIVNQDMTISEPDHFTGQQLLDYFILFSRSDVWADDKQHYQCQYGWWCSSFERLPLGGIDAGFSQDIHYFLNVRSASKRIWMSALGAFTKCAAFASIFGDMFIFEGSIFSMEFGIPHRTERLWMLGKAGAESSDLQANSPRSQHG